MSWVPGPYICARRAAVFLQGRTFALSEHSGSMTTKPLRRGTGSFGCGRDFGQPQAMPDQDTTRIVSPMILPESKSQNGSEMVKNFAIVVQGDLCLWHKHRDGKCLSMQ